MGIGGAGMTALAYFLKSAGYSVFGSDILCGQNVKKLEKDGFKIFGQHSSENIKGAKACNIHVRREKGQCRNKSGKKIENKNAFSRKGLSAHFKGV